jgi:hypothetical protein
VPTASVAPLVIDVGLFQPSTNVKHIVELVRLRMERMRMPSEIEGIAVDVVAVGETACRQQTLFESLPGAAAASSSAHEVGMLFDRLSGRLGRGAVFAPQPVADAQPEHAWVPTAPAANVGGSKVGAGFGPIVSRGFFRKARRSRKEAGLDAAAAAAAGGRVGRAGWPAGAVSAWLADPRGRESPRPGADRNGLVARADRAARLLRRRDKDGGTVLALSPAAGGRMVSARHVRLT